MYDYLEAMKNDVKRYVEENREAVSEAVDAEEYLRDTLWAEDSVTGNASGSYTFNGWTAMKYVTDNMDLCAEALTELGTDITTVGEKFLANDWEWFDVTIRCYLLVTAILEVLDEIDIKGRG